MENCIFCKIVAGDIKADITYTDEHTIAFLDLHPKGPSHTLVVPRAHYTWFQDMPDTASDPLFRTAKKLASALKEDTGADYIHLSIVGQDVPHVHVHLIPKKFSKDAGVLPHED